MYSMEKGKKIKSIKIREKKYGINIPSLICIFNSKI